MRVSHVHCLYVQVVGESLSLENYRARFHQLLYMEEISQYQEVTGFNAALNIHVSFYFRLFSPDFFWINFS